MYVFMLIRTCKPELKRNFRNEIEILKITRDRNGDGKRNFKPWLS